MLFQAVYGIAFVLFLTKTTTEGSEHGVYFQIKENSFFGFSKESLVWSGKADSLLSCSVLSGQETSCRRANFLENQRLCHLLRGEMQTSSAALTVTQGSIGLPMILWEEHSQTKRKMVTFHMVTFLCEPSGKDIVKKPHVYLSEVIEFLKSLHPRTDEHLFPLSVYFL